MTDPTVEDRLARMLDEVAGRIPDRRPPLELADHRPEGRRRWPLLAAAAALALLVGGALLLGNGNGDGRPVLSEARREALSIPFDGGRLSLRVSGRCATLHAGSSDLGYPTACAGTRMALATTVRAGRTIAYGLAPDVVRVDGAVSDGSAPVVEQRRIGGSVAFLLVSDVPGASGSISASDADGTVLSVEEFDADATLAALGGLDAGESVVLAYHEAGAVWAATSEGRRLRLTDGGAPHEDGYPFAAPDGHTVVFASGTSGVFWHQIALDTRSGTRRDIAVVNSATFSADGRHLAGSRPVDDEVDIEVVVLDTVNYQERARIVVPKTVGEWVTLSWAADGRHLLAQGQNRSELWWLDVESGAAERLDAGEAATWTMADRAASDGAFAAVRVAGHGPVWGKVRVQGARATFEAVRPLPTEVDGVRLALAGQLSLRTVRGHLYVSDTGALLLDEDAPPSHLLSDGRNVLELTDSGALVLLLPGAGFASAP